MGGIPFLASSFYVLSIQRGIIANDDFFKNYFGGLMMKR